MQLSINSLIRKITARQLVMLAMSAALLQACSSGTDKGTKPETSTGSAATGTSTETKTGTEDTQTATKTDAQTATGPGTGTGTETGTGTGTGTDTETGTGSGTGSPGTTPEGSKQTQGNKPVNINLQTLPNDTPICVVAGSTIRVGDFKRMLRIQQIQLNSSLANNPVARAQMLQLAKEKKVTLTAEERSKVLQAARAGKGDFKEYLKQVNLTEAKFDEEVINTALAFKISNMIIEQGLLPELVNRELMAQYSLEQGGDKKAMDQYFRFKHSKAYNLLAEQTQLSPDDLKKEIYKAELAKLQLSKLEKQVKVTEPDLKKLYELNKPAFKHGEQMKLARIVVLCPEKDVGPIRSVRTQVLAAKPELKDKEKELDAVTAQVMEQQRQKALLALGRAIGGEDFAKLANEVSDDMTTRLEKNGGDMGYIEKGMLVPQMAEHLWPLKAGQVLKQVVKDDAGYAIYKCTGRKPAGFASFAEAKPLLEAKAKQEKLNQILSGWLNQRRQVVRIEFAPKFLALAQNMTQSQSSKQPQ